MLPFDLHVLGLPPAFTLSQDQTLHLSFAANPEGSAKALKCRARSRHQKLACICMLLNLCACYETSAMDSHPPPDARTSHLRTLSKIPRSGLSAFPSSLTPPNRQSVRVSRPF